MWTTAIGIITFLISNKDQIISAGKNVADLVREVIGMINGADSEGRTDLTKDEFNAFVDKALGAHSAEMDQLIAQAKSEIG